LKREAKVGVSLAMSSSEISELERRVKAIEKEIQELREPIYTTVTDLRSTLAELENPFNYISKIIETVSPKGEKKGEGGASKAVGESVKGAANIDGSEGRELEAAAAKEGANKNFDGSDGFRINPEEWQRQFNILVVSNLLLEVFDREELMKVLAEYVKDGWISRGLAKTIEEAVDKLTINRKGALDGVGLEEHLLTLYILYKLSNQPNDPVLPLLLILLNKLRRSANAK
jgi:hypothetical protein